MEDVNFSFDHILRSICGAGSLHGDRKGNGLERAGRGRTDRCQGHRQCQHLHNLSVPRPLHISPRSLAEPNQRIIYRLLQTSMGLVQLASRFRGQLAELVAVRNTEKSSKDKIRTHSYFPSAERLRNIARFAQFARFFPLHPLSTALAIKRMYSSTLHLKRPFQRLCCRLSLELH